VAKEKLDQGPPKSARQENGIKSGKKKLCQDWEGVWENGRHRDMPGGFQQRTALCSSEEKGLLGVLKWVGPHDGNPRPEIHIRTINTQILRGVFGQGGARSERVRGGGELIHLNHARQRNNSKALSHAGTREKPKEGFSMK